MRRVRSDLVKHCGGKPSATQKALIERAAWLSLYVARLDAKAMESGAMTEHDAKQYLAWSNSLSRTMKQLGYAGVPEKPPSPMELLAKARSAA
jgi:hypothetical protein